MRAVKFVLPIALLFSFACSSDRPPKSEEQAASRSASSVLEGKLVKSPDDTRIYLIDKGKKRWVTSPDALQRNGFRWEDVKQVSAPELSAVPDGSPIE